MIHGWVVLARSFRSHVSIGPRGGSVGLERLQADEVDVGVVERVVRLGARREPARFAGLGQREDVVVRAGLRRRVGAVAVVVAERGHSTLFRSMVGKHVEHRGLVLGVRAVRVGVVAEHQPQVRMARAGERVVRVAHGARVRVGGARIAQDPDAGRLRRARDRGRAGRSAWRRRRRAPSCRCPRCSSRSCSAAGR